MNRVGILGAPKSPIHHTLFLYWFTAVNLRFQAPHGAHDGALEGARSPAGRDPDSSLSWEMNRAGILGAPKSPIHHTSFFFFNTVYSFSRPGLRFSGNYQVGVGVFLCNDSYTSVLWSACDEAFFWYIERALLVARAIFTEISEWISSHYCELPDSGSVQKIHDLDMEKII